MRYNCKHNKFVNKENWLCMIGEVNCTHSCKFYEKQDEPYESDKVVELTKRILNILKED